MTTWGEPIQCNGRPAWLSDGEDVRWSHGTNGDGEVCRAGTLDWRGDDICPVLSFRLPAAHWAYAPISAGFTPWAGGDSAPDDWDGGIDSVYYRDGKDTGPSGGKREVRRWYHLVGGNHHADIIGYRRRETPAAPAERDVLFDRMAALVRKIDAYELVRGHSDAVASRFGHDWQPEARAIAKLLPEPVDPIEERAKELAQIAWPFGEWRVISDHTMEAFRRLARAETEGKSV